MSVWQSIDSAPKNGTRVLVFIPGELTWTDSDGTVYPHYEHGIHAARFERELSFQAYKLMTGQMAPAKNGAWVIGGSLYGDETLECRFDEPTHWMPLPKPPTD